MHLHKYTEKMHTLMLNITVMLTCSTCYAYGNENNMRFRVVEISEISYGYVIGSHAARGLVDCSAACTEQETCRAVTYDLTSQVCVRYSLAIPGLICTNGTCLNMQTLKYGTTIDVCMTSMKYSCLSNAHCIDANSVCRDGMCKCHAGLQYDPNTCGCVTDCTVYGDTFQTEVGRFIGNENLLIATTATQLDCQQLCLDATYICRTYEYDFDTYGCRLSNVTSLTHTTYSDLSQNLYTRDCALE